MKTLSLLLIFVLAIPLSVAEETSKKKDPINFYTEQKEKSEEHYQFNPYENIISGTAAFVIGNIGYLASDSAGQELAYAAIQTIGIINIGQGIYKLKSPNVDASFYKLLTNRHAKHYSKEEIAKNLLQISAEEARAKRLSLFYSSSFLTVQYLLNATVYGTIGKLKNIYIFLGGINAIVAVYTGFYKSDAEKYLFGEGIDISPFAFRQNQSNGYGAMISYRF